MAGSWDHMTTTPGGKLLNNEKFCGMIENLGDAYEAAEDCYGMVWWLADQLANLIYSNGPEKPSREFTLGLVEQAASHENIKIGIRLGGRQRER